MNKAKAYVEAPACDIDSGEEFAALNVVSISSQDPRSWVLEFLSEERAGVERPHVRYVDYRRPNQRDGFWFEANQISLWTNHRAVRVEYDEDTPDGFQRVRVDIPPAAFLNMIADVIGDRETLIAVRRLLPERGSGNWLIGRLLSRPIANTIAPPPPAVQYSVAPDEIPDDEI